MRGKGGRRGGMVVLGYWSRDCDVKLLRQVLTVVGYWGVVFWVFEV